MSNETTNGPPGFPVEAFMATAAEAMTDGMVERAAITAANALEVVDRLNDETTREAVLALIDGLTRLHKSGALATVFDLIGLVHAAREAMTDSMVERLLVFVEHMVSNLATEQIAELARESQAAMQDAILETNTKSGPPSLFGMLAELRQPETLRSLSFLLSLGRHMHARSENLVMRPPV